MTPARLIPVLLLLAACTRGHGSGKSAQAALPKLELETYRLANGMTVTLHVDPTFPEANVNLWYHVGSKDEGPGRSGYAHLFERLMFAGSKNAKGDFATLIERGGADLKSGGVNGGADFDRSAFFEAVPPEALEYALWLESDRMGFLADGLDQRALDAVKAQIAQERGQQEARPFGVGRELMAAGLYPSGHPYGHPTAGFPADVASATLADVQAFDRAHYGPNNASLVITGRFDKTQAKTLISQYFGSLAPGEPLTRPKPLVPLLDADKVIVREERVNQAKLQFAWNVPEFFHKDEASLDLYARVLGDGPSARLQKRLIQIDKLATQVAAYLTPGELAGVLQIEALLLPGASADKARLAILDEVTRLAATGPTDSELAQRKSAFEYEMVSSLERQGGFGGRADRLNRYQTFLGTADKLMADAERYGGVSPTDVAHAAKEWVTPRHHLEIRFLPDHAGQPDQPEPARAKAPAVAQTAPFTPPPIERKTLANGLELIVVNRPGLPKVEAGLVLKHLDLSEPEGAAGASHLTAVAALAGTKTRTAEQLRAELDTMGAELVSDGGKFGAGVVVSTLKRHLDKAVDLLADVVENPVFPADDVETAKRQASDRLGADLQSPVSMANLLFQRILLAGGHPGGIPDEGTLASLAALTRVDLVKNHETFWAPNNAALILAGDVTMAEAETLASRTFGGWQTRPVPEPAVPPPGAPAKPYVFLYDQPGAREVQIRVGSVAPPRQDADYAALQLANGILGGGFASRLSQNLRSEKGYAYVAFSGLTQNRWFGTWMAATAVQPGVVAAALTEIRKEVTGLATDRLATPEEISAQAQMLGRGLVQHYLTLAETVRTLAPMLSAGVNPDQLTTFATDVAKIPADDVTAAVKRHLSFDHAVVLVTGDLSQIEKPVAALAWGDTLIVNQEGKLLRRAGEAGPNAAGAMPAADAGQQPLAPEQQQQPLAPEQQQQQLTPEQQAHMQPQSAPPPLPAGMAPGQADEERRRHMQQALQQQPPPPTAEQVQQMQQQRPSDETQQVQQLQQMQQHEQRPQDAEPPPLLARPEP